jgi:hypothetical protein
LTVATITDKISNIGAGADVAAVRHFFFYFGSFCLLSHPTGRLSFCRLQRLSSFVEQTVPFCFVVGWCFPISGTVACLMAYKALSALHMFCSFGQGQTVDIHCVGVGCRWRIWGASFLGFSRFIQTLSLPMIALARRHCPSYLAAAVYHPLRVVSTFSMLNTFSKSFVFRPSMILSQRMPTVSGSLIRVHAVPAS